ncbi:MAG: 4-hydroxythreonine-4-phosphate dehydrogenase PdxA [Chromatiales bacterium]|jgi:4-hydroxythreonine-4-phosphate dehydrogenase|nr:4-hydroxythreonine-4-phosphate dehydrogenase PdxA [Chromatiales bacterium]
MKIALTAGEPGGIGPDLCIQIAAQDDVRNWARTTGAELVVIADPELMRERAAQLCMSLTFTDYIAERKAQPGAFSLLPITGARQRCGIADPASARYVLATLDRALAGCLSGEFDAMVTGPVHKAAVNQGGIPFTGHTEYLADATQTPQVVMMLATPGLRVALVTTHLRLRDVPDAITRERVENTLRITLRDLRHYFGIDKPRILVCGLNPHAGEGGELGSEDDEHIRPAIEQLIREGFDVRGPQPADSAFVPEALVDTDLVLAMYHDQGLPVLKHRGFGAAVNITLGLPIVRTSVDHGTALTLAGTGTADSGSMIHAIHTAQQMVMQKMLSASRAAR